MKKASFLLTALAGSLFLLNSCDDIIAKDITEDLPVVIMPQDDDSVAANPVHFKWEALTGATKYHLQIVSPSFANIQTYALDSVVTGTDFFFALDSNIYEFRMTALNAGYESQTTNPITFWVGTSASTPGTVVVLTDPAANDYVNETFDGKFEWNVLTEGDHYMFEIHEGASFSGATIDVIPDIQSYVVTSTASTGDTLPEGQYTWGVKAYMNNGDETAYTKRTLYVDKTAPGIASMSSPASGSNASGTVSFTWSMPNDVGLAVSRSPVRAVIQIASNSGFTGSVVSEPVALAGATSASFNPGLPNGIYYWRILLEDEAGNLGAAPSIPVLFNYQP